ncbi:tyrosine-type recombinase/integrase [Acinetobacter pittii]|uniref:tyrosine-type recombinase/integrase n=1 Tax=Acinetobacter pittii TaxID=48296 RepID=UPI00301B8252
MKKSEIKRRPLSDTVLASLEPELKEYREPDGAGLYFRVKPNGNKSWQLRYKNPQTGKDSLLGLGGYPAVSGKLARKKAEDARQLIANGKDPKEYKEEQKQALLNSDQFSFKSLAIEYCESKIWTTETRLRNEGALQNHVYPVMGSRDYRKITKKEWLDLIMQIQDKPNPRTGRPIIEMGNRIRGLCKDIYGLAEFTDRIDYNPLSGTFKYVKKHTKQNMPHVTVDELPELLRSIRSFHSKQTSIGLQLSIMFGCRPSEMRKAVWSEFDLDKKVWIIPANRMKKRVEHTIPLSTQVLNLLQELKIYSGNSPYLFRGRLKANQPVSINTFGKALKDMGYKGKQTPHGFRHIMSTLLREKGFHREWVEAALAHKVGGVEGVYNKAVYLEPRRIMMQIWADYLDNLAEGKVSNNTILDSNDISIRLGNLAEEMNLNYEQKMKLEGMISSESESWNFSNNKDIA